MSIYPHCWQASDVLRKPKLLKAKFIGGKKRRGDGSYASISEGAVLGAIDGLVEVAVELESACLLSNTRLTAADVFLTLLLLCALQRPWTSSDRVVRPAEDQQ
jgi:hypothetical protein